MKAVSVSAELIVIQRAVLGVADFLDVGNIDHPPSDDTQLQVVATLNLVAVRMRDLGRAARGRMPLELLWAPHNDAGPDAEQETSSRSSSLALIVRNSPAIRPPLGRQEVAAGGHLYLAGTGHFYLGGKRTSLLGFDIPLLAQRWRVGRPSS